MSRVKGGVTSQKRRKNTLKQVKGYRFGRSKKKRQAREAIAHAGSYAFAHRRDKKNDFRRGWQMVISAAAKAHRISYSAFMGALKKSHSELDRKMLATIARERADVFSRIVAKIK